MILRSINNILPISVLQNQGTKRFIFISHTIDLQNLEWFHAKKPPPENIVDAVRVAIRDNNFFNIKNHSLNTAIFTETKKQSKLFFDLESQIKAKYAIYNMERSRGWEMYPQHRKFHATVTGRGAVVNKDNPTPKKYPPQYIESLKSHPEPSTRQGILCERFVMGPPEVCDLDTTSLSSPYYSSEFGKIFYAKNVYPEEVPSLRPTAYSAYKEFELLSRALLHIISLILGASHHTSLDPLFYNDNAFTPIRHHSRMQINNYPTIFESFFAKFGPERANRHLDTSILTILSRDGVTDNHMGRGGSLEILTPCTNEWEVVPILPGELTVQTGSLCEYLSGGLIKGATHKVSNPDYNYCEKSTINRRFSISYVLKPDYLYPAAPISLLEKANFSPSDDYHISDPETVKKYYMNGFELFPLIGEVGRIGWQNIQINYTGITRETAVSQFKPWKIEMRERLNMRKKKDSDHGKELIS